MYFFFKKKSNGLLTTLLFSSLEAGICAQKSVTSLVDDMGVPYCDTGALYRWKLKK